MLRQNLESDVSPYAGNLKRALLEADLEGAPNLWTSLELAKLLSSLTSPVVTVIGFIFVWKQLKNTGFQIEIARAALDASNDQTKRTQAWKRAEFVAGEVKLLLEDSRVNAVLQMLDYEARHFDIGIVDKEGKSLRTKIVHLKAGWPRGPEDESYVALEDALKTHNDGTFFSDEEVIVREMFDVFLNGVERFERFVRAQLVSEDEVIPYLGYYLRLLNFGLEPELRRIVHAYLQRYNFDEAENFIYRRFEKFKFNNQTSGA